MSLALPYPLVLRRPRPSLLAAATILLVCVPTGEKDVTAAVHITPADLASLALVALMGLDLLRGRRLGLSPQASVIFAGVVCAAAPPPSPRSTRPPA